MFIAQQIIGLDCDIAKFTRWTSKTLSETRNGYFGGGCKNLQICKAKQKFQSYLKHFRKRRGCKQLNDYKNAKIKQSKISTTPSVYSAKLKQRKYLCILEACTENIGILGNCIWKSFFCFLLRFVFYGVSLFFYSPGNLTMHTSLILNALCVL